MKKTTQLYVVCPEELNNAVSSAVNRTFEEFSKNFNKPKDRIDWMTRKEVCEMLGISFVTLHNWTKKDILFSYKIGNQVRYKRREVESSLSKTR